MPRAKISFRHACSKEEMEFCRKVAAGLPAATAYARVFLREVRRGNSVERYDPDDFIQKRGKDSELVDGAKAISSKEVSRRAGLLKSQEHVKGYLAELEGAEPGDRAREVLAEQAMFGDEMAARSAAKQILDDEDKLGMRDAHEQWAYIMCAIGAEVVVPLPDGGEAVTDLREMFPRYRDALPPVDVIDKTIRSLQDYKEAQQAREEEN